MSITYQPLYDPNYGLQFHFNNKLNDVSLKLEIEYSHTIHGIDDIDQRVWYKTDFLQLDCDQSDIVLNFPHLIKFTRTAKIHLRVNEWYLTYLYFYPIISQSVRNTVDILGGRGKPVVKFNNHFASHVDDHSICLIC